MNKSRQKAFLTGANGSYETDVVRGKSELSDSNGFNGSTDTTYFGNYSTVYRGGIDGSVALGKPDYSNPGNIFHNNVGDRVITEQLYDNRLFIDSLLSDHSVYSEPFKFVIKFNGREPKTENIYVIIDGESFGYPKYLEGDTCVVLDRMFKNVKLVTINSLIMPSSIEYKVNKETGAYEKTGRKLAKAAYKYLILKINELSNGRTFSNSKAFGQEAFIMKMDDEICFNNHRWIPISNNISYPDAKLQSIDRFNIEICNDRGTILYPTLDGKPHDFYGDYRKTIDKIVYLQTLGTPSSEAEIKKLLPKLFSLKEIVMNLSPELHMTFTTYEPQVNTLPQFRH
jgi:hypothetical protein